MAIKEFIQNFVDNTKVEIFALAQTELDNKTKKERLDATIIAWATRTLDTLPINFIAKIVLKKLVVGNIGIITQAIYDLIKLKFTGITKEG